ncbi:tegument protein UL16 [Equid alphaherpesvirus 3]|uniref:Tegument protein UL16 n=1 Tax=Equid alphaherpesvirus 3 TaxID=80341 RepID=A0A077B7L9_9ALPH|nr:tegument protein UL16 [Equid alphaherpesvirus 3]AIL02964.1 tegument protein UL16 [Equid alphaherpesvirus 3]
MAGLSGNSSLWDEFPTGADRKLTHEAARRLAEALTEDVAALRLVRGDPRVKIFRAVSVLSPRLAPFVPPPPPKMSHASKCAAVTIYLTRPKALALQPKQFHALVVFGQDAAYSLVVRVKSRPLFQGAHRFRVVFQDASPVPSPADVPDPAAETVPAEVSEQIDVSAFATPAEAPEEKYDCRVLAPGVWWSTARQTIYFLQMDAALLALCPAGWRARGLGIILGRLVNHPEGCSACRFAAHADPLNAAVESAATPESCLCWAPCLWRKAGQREISVSGDCHLFRVLFMDAVERVRLTGLRRSPKITPDLADVLVGLGPHGQQIPVNSSGWKLAVLDPDISRLLVCGCTALRYLCLDGPRGEEHRRPSRRASGRRPSGSGRSRCGEADFD